VLHLSTCCCHAQAVAAELATPADALSRQVQLLRLLLPDLDLQLASSSAAQQHWIDVAQALQEMTDAILSGSISSDTAAAFWAQQEPQLMILVHTAVG
jgi:hypothetical protein